MSSAMRKARAALVMAESNASNPDRDFSSRRTAPDSMAVVEADAESSLAELEDLIRLLRVSGRRLVDCDGEWRILPRGDRRRRPLAIVSAGDVERLQRENLLVRSAAGYVLSTGHAKVAEQPAAGPWIFGTAGAARSKRWRGFTRLVELAHQGKGPLSVRQGLAGLRLIEDAEMAARDPMLTMNWDAVPSDRNTRNGGKGGLQPYARRAAMRIQRIREALGKRDFAIVHAICVERLSSTLIERRFGIKRLGTHKLLAVALEKAAEVYDG